MLRKTGLAVLLALLAETPVPGQDWARKMFVETKHDFGHVARGAKAEYQFVLSNRYLEDVHIASVRPSCGCTHARIGTAWLKTYEKGAIIASLNTQSFLGRRRATITVVFDKPSHAEVQLQVSGYVRGDVVLNPGSVAFGSLDKGTPADAKVLVEYAGHRDWKILQVKSNSQYISGKVVEIGRGGGRVSYELRAHLDRDAPVGYLDEHLLLITNDDRSPQIPVRVEGRVLSAVTVSPKSLFLGVVQPGRQVVRQIVLRGKEPFRIMSITCDDSLRLQTSPDTTPKSLQVIPVTLLGGANPGKVVRQIQIETDLEGTIVELTAYAVVSPP